MKPIPTMVVSKESDMLKPGGGLNLSSPYLAGVGGTPGYEGVGTLMIKGDALKPGYATYCTGSLISPTLVVTAAHCVANPEVGTLKSIQFAVPNGRILHGVSPAPNPGPLDIAVGGAITTLPGWDIKTLGEDLAVVKLDAPMKGVPTYDLFRGDPMGRQFSVVGTGTSGWGAVGADSETGYLGGIWDLRKRVGENTFDEYASDFYDAFLNYYGIDLRIGGPDKGVLLYDFDSGLAQNDVFGLLCDIPDPALASLCVKQTGIAHEAGTAPGDSGGPLFVDGKIAGITSWGQTGAILSFDGQYIYCGGPKDIDVSFDVDSGSCTDSSFGEINGVTNISYYADYLDSVLAGKIAFQRVPEPASIALVLAGLAGFGAFRRKRK
ncbi:hypothetical protein GCM10008941_14560 [Rhizomicrobium palustre]